MISLRNYDSMGQNALALMQNSLDMAGATASKLASGDADVMDVAAASMDMSQAKVGMAVGAYLIKSQEELMNSTLQILGVGTNYSSKG